MIRSVCDSNRFIESKPEAGTTSKTHARRRLGFQSPQTVLKTAGPSSIAVQQRPLEFGRCLADSVTVRPHPRSCVILAVMLAVSGTTGASLSRGSSFTPCVSTSGDGLVKSRATDQSQ